MPPLRNLPIDETPVAVIDFETTGLCPGTDRVVEVAVVRIEPGQEPSLVLDTLVNPRRSMACTEIHGITDDDVKDAPEFSDIAEEFVASIAGCAVAAYNVYFDLGFLNYELSRARLGRDCPYLCLMYMRPMLNLGKRCSLADACAEYGIVGGNLHHAAGDALPGAELYRVYQGVCRERGFHTFGELSTLHNYKFCRSWELDPLPQHAVGKRGLKVARAQPAQAPNITHPERRPKHGGRGIQIEIRAEDKPDPLREYWEVLKLVIADLDVTDDELEYVERKRQDLGLSEDQVRSQHARAFASVIMQFTDDRRIDDREREKLRRLKWALHRLGWAPGE